MPLTLDVLLFNLCDLTHVVHKILVSTRTWSRLSCKFHKRGTLSGPINHKTRKRSLWSCYSWQNQWIESRLSNKAAKFEKNDDLQIRIELKVKSVPILAARSSTFEHYMKIEGIDISYKPKSAKDWRNIKGIPAKSDLYISVCTEILRTELPDFGKLFYRKWRMRAINEWYQAVLWQQFESGVMNTVQI